MPYSIPHLTTVGNHYDTGLIIGTEFKHRINEFIKLYSEFHSQIIPFINADRGKKVLNDYHLLIEKRFPWYLDEMKGISHGSGVDFDWILALNCRVELFHITNQEKSDHKTVDNSAKECSDFMLVDKENYLLIHNEDSVESVYNTCYIVTCKIQSSIYNEIVSPEEEFTCYCYPGHLAGNAFGFNSSGFCLGVNALYPREILLDRFPRQIINRVMMSAKSLEHLEDILLRTPISYGVCLNVCYFGEDLHLVKSNWTSPNDNNKETELLLLEAKMGWNYELAPNSGSELENLVSKHCIVEPFDSKELTNYFYTQRYYYHFNHYERFQVEECYNASSQNRKKRADQMSEPKDINDLINISSDKTNAIHPIFRTLNKDDKEELKTIATALFDCDKKTMTVFTERPSESKPFLVIKMN